jgi:large subunit ribosomal protein L41
MEKTRKLENGYEAYPKRLTGEDYLKAWKLSGGYDPVEMTETRPYTNMPTPFEEKAATKPESKS